jgi:hypothetical protein
MAKNFDSDIFMETSFSDGISAMNPNSGGGFLAATDWGVCMYGCRPVLQPVINKKAARKMNDDFFNSEFMGNLCNRRTGLSEPLQNNDANSNYRIARATAGE